MKYIKIIFAALLAITLTACSDTNAAEEITSLPETTSGTLLTEESPATTEAAAASSETTTTAESMTEITEEQTLSSESTAETTNAGNTDVAVPDNDFLLKMINSWQSGVDIENGKDESVQASPAGGAKAVYADIDGDGIKEFCFISATYHGSSLYVCEYLDMQWKVVYALTISDRYTYLRKNDDGTESLFVINGIRSVEGLDCYVYEKGVKEEFELLDEEKLYDELAKIDDMNEREDAYYAAIEEALKNYDDLTSFNDLPCVIYNAVMDTQFLGSDYVPEGFDIDSVQKKFDEFSAKVAELFQ